jgi:hypothetical protein
MYIIPDWLISWLILVSVCHTSIPVTVYHSPTVGPAPFCHCYVPRSVGGLATLCPLSTWTGDCLGTSVSSSFLVHPISLKRAVSQQAFPCPLSPLTQRPGTSPHIPPTMVLFEEVDSKEQNC